MSNSAILKSSIAKKYWMAFTGLFLCLFLAGHLAGNLQLLMSGEGGQIQFNDYALFMTTNPAVKILSYVTYISILFHVIDGIALTMKNRASRPEGYAYSKPGNSSKWYSRKMALLGTVILIFIITHMVNFWAKMHFSEMPLTIAEKTLDNGEMVKLYRTSHGDFVRADQIKIEGRSFIDPNTNTKVGTGVKDLHSVVLAFFGKKPVKVDKADFPVNSNGALFAVLYALSMVVLMFHLMHGVSSSFQSLGLRVGQYAKIINFIGMAFAIVVSVLFAIIPLFIAFS